MRELKSLRGGGDAFEEIETRLLQELSIQESVRQWLALQRAFARQLEETADLFEEDRRAALAELQSRLRRLAEWQQQHGISVSLSSHTQGEI